MPGGLQVSLPAGPRPEDGSGRSEEISGRSEEGSGRSEEALGASTLPSDDMVPEYIREDVRRAEAAALEKERQEVRRDDGPSIEPEAL